MPRPRKRRACHAFAGDPVFKPRSIPMTELEVTELGLSELEAMRLCDLEGLDQEQAGARMGVSRGTVQRLLKSARAKVVGCLVANGALHIRKGEEDAHMRSHGD
ncbi:MAG: DUF134 domain-containing protein [Gemmatimonadetes bacterium]|nr:DUF134 domain-containing protein [Gemmatimonadota bacterium]